jgi:hypothetical protein
MNVSALSSWGERPFNKYMHPSQHDAPFCIRVQPQQCLTLLGSSRRPACSFARLAVGEATAWKTCGVRVCLRFVLQHYGTCAVATVSAMLRQPRAVCAVRRLRPHGKKDLISTGHIFRTSTSGTSRNAHEGAAVAHVTIALVRCHTFTLSQSTVMMSSGSLLRLAVFSPPGIHLT